jgi:SNF2 family DNA or RNA helicase
MSITLPGTINAQVIATPADPADLTVQNPRDDITLLPYQVEGVRFMLAREAKGAPICRGGILGDDMGLGKTFQCISLIKSSPLTTARNLIVCPPALVAGWTEELQACGFSVYHLRAGKAEWVVASTVTGTALAGTVLVAGGDSTGRPVWVTTYPKVTIYKRLLCSQEPFDRVILDEGHCIRNGPATERWRACVALTKKSTARWILSATPVQNGGTDWRNLCWWLRANCKSADIRTLAPVIMLRRTMAELRGVLDSLPPVAEWKVHDLHITYPEEAAIFQALANQLEEAMESRHVSTLMKLELYMRIQQFVVHPQVYIESMRRKFGASYPRPDWSAGTTKWTACFAELASCVRRAVPTIIFCQFRVEMDMAAVAASAMGAKVWSIRGGMTSASVGAAVREARETVVANSGLSDDDRVPVVLIIQIVAGGAGLNLQFCQSILFLSQHWNPAVVHQAVGRAVRIGQRAIVQIHVFRVVDSVMDNIDLRMADLHGVKVAGAQGICSTFFQGFAPFLPAPVQKITPVLPVVLPSAVLPVVLPQDPTIDEDPTSPAAAA